MTNIITEARELCERATPGEWKVKLHSEDYGQGYGETTYYIDMEDRLLKIGLADSPEKCAKHNTLATFIARSRTLIHELCDALEKAEEQNKQLVREVSALAAESVERDKALAKLEAEVEHAITATRWIPVAERLPERNDKILAYTPPKPGYAELCEVTRGFMAQLGKRSSITHWMPLPEPPEDKP